MMTTKMTSFKIHWIPKLFIKNLQLEGRWKPRFFLLRRPSPSVQLSRENFKSTRRLLRFPLDNFP